MPQFEYIAMTEAGARVTGALEAETESAAARALADKRLFPVTIQGRGGALKNQAKKRRVKNSDLGTCYGQLADLLGSGVPLLRALDSLIKSTPNVNLRDLLKEIRASVADGKTLTDTLRQWPGIFPPLHTAMIQAGERAAFLEQVLRSLSGFIERFEELRSKVIGALIYPALLSGLGAVVMILALMFFVPKFEPLLANVKKPLPSELMFALSHLVRGYWYLVVGGLAAGGAALFAPSAGDDLGAWQVRTAAATAALMCEAALFREESRGAHETRTLAVEGAGGGDGPAPPGHYPLLPHSWHHAGQRRATLTRA